MTIEKVVIYTSPMMPSDNDKEEAICAIERNGKSFVMYSADNDTAKVFRDRITKSSAATDVDTIEEDEDGNSYSTLVKIVGQLYGLLVGSTAHNDVTESSFDEAKNALKIRTTFKVK